MRFEDLLNQAIDRLEKGNSATKIDKLFLRNEILELIKTFKTKHTKLLTDLIYVISEVAKREDREQNIFPEAIYREIHTKINSTPEFKEVGKGVFIKGMIENNSSSEKIFPYFLQTINRNSHLDLIIKNIPTIKGSNNAGRIDKAGKYYSNLESEEAKLVKEISMKQLIENIYLSNFTQTNHLISILYINNSGKEDVKMLDERLKTLADSHATTHFDQIKNMSFALAHMANKIGEKNLSQTYLKLYDQLWFQNRLGDELGKGFETKIATLVNNKEYY